MTNKLVKIQTPTDSYTRHYPRIVELANIQLEKQLWFSSEMKVELDALQMKYELSPEQLHAIKYVLNLFVYYELQVGDMWNKIARLFPRPEVKLACSVVEMTERAIHAEFYNQINIVLGLDKEEDYVAFMNDPELAKRAKWIGEQLNSEDQILGVIIFSMTETALLFSPFSIIKSHQSNGYNKIPVTVRGANQSAVDEDLHGQISAEIINTYYSELGTTLFDDKKRYLKVKEAIHHVLEHEKRINRLAIPSGELNGIKVEEFDNFVKHRLNVYCERLGLPNEFEVGECSIIDWFGKNTYSYKMIDFFSAGVGQEYESSWNKEAFGKGLEKVWGND